MGSLNSDPNSVIYACASKGSEILAEFTTGDPDLDAMALKCIENAPQFHSVFSHTARGRTYTFVIDDPFVYLGFFNESLEKAQGLWFLYRIKDAFEGILRRASIKSYDSLTSYCFQGEMNPIFRDLLARSLGSPDCVQPVMKDSQNKSNVSEPLLGNPGKGLKKKKKKKKRGTGEDNGEVRDIVGDNKVVDVSSDDDGDGVMLTREFSQKNGLLAGDVGRQEAKERWRKLAWVVLMVDLVVCCLLFGIWLGICSGFKCING